MVAAMARSFLGNTLYKCAFVSAYPLVSSKVSCNVGIARTISGGYGIIVQQFTTASALAQPQAMVVDVNGTRLEHISLEDASRHAKERKMDLKLVRKGARIPSASSGDELVDIYRIVDTGAQQRRQEQV